MLIFGNLVANIICILVSMICLDILCYFYLCYNIFTHKMTYLKGTYRSFDPRPFQEFEESFFKFEKNKYRTSIVKKQIQDKTYYVSYAGKKHLLLSDDCQLIAYCDNQDNCYIGYAQESLGFPHIKDKHPIMRQQICFDNLKSYHVHHSHLVLTNNFEDREWKFTFVENYLLEEWRKLLDNLLSLHQRKPRRHISSKSTSHQSLATKMDSRFIAEYEKRNSHKDQNINTHKSQKDIATRMNSIFGINEAEKTNRNKKEVTLISQILHTQGQGSEKRNNRTSSKRESQLNNQIMIWKEKYQKLNRKYQKLVACLQNNDKTSSMMKRQSSETHENSQSFEQESNHIIKTQKVILRSKTKLSVSQVKKIKSQNRYQIAQESTAMMASVDLIDNAKLKAVYSNLKPYAMIINSCTQVFVHSTLQRQFSIYSYQG